MQRTSHVLIIWNSLLSVGPSDGSEKNRGMRTFDQLNVVRDEAHIILHLQAWMSGISENEIAGPWTVKR